MSLELETRWSLFSQPGKLRTIGWFNSAYLRQLSRDAEQSRAQPRHCADPHGPHQIRLRRQSRAGAGRRYRRVRPLELERRQERDHGLHRHRRLAVDRRLSIKGARWGRPDDVIGIGGAINALSRDHRDFIAAGGLGVLIGDGALNYRRERVLEAYYAYALTKGDHADGRLSAHHQPRLQRRPRPGAHFLRPAARGVLRRRRSTSCSPSCTFCIRWSRPDRHSFSCRPSAGRRTPCSLSGQALCR